MLGQKRKTCATHAHKSGPSLTGRTSRFTALTLALTLAAAPVMAEVCASPTDQDALGSRVLQSRLMVAALSCNQRPAYNAVMQSYKTIFAADGQALRSFFSRTYGNRASTELNAFATRMANDASRHSTQNVRAFCQASDQAFQSLLSSNTSGYLMLRDKFVDPVFHGYRACTQTSKVTD